MEFHEKKTWIFCSRKSLFEWAARTAGLRRLGWLAPKHQTAVTGHVLVGWAHQKNCITRLGLFNCSTLERSAAEIWQCWVVMSSLRELTDGCRSFSSWGTCSAEPSWSLPKFGASVVIPNSGRWRKKLRWSTSNNVWCWIPPVWCWIPLFERLLS